MSIEAQQKTMGLDTKYFSVVAKYGILMLIGYWTCCVVYNLFFHPLRRIPGPYLYASSRLPIVLQIITGRLATKLHALHEQYGPVVRTASNEVSFIEPEAWDTIYGKKNARHHEFPKNYETWNETENSFTKTLFLASDEDHPRMRKALSPAFSKRMLSNNEPFLRKHIDNFLHGVEHASQQEQTADTRSSRQPVDLNAWYSWLAFDLASEFVLGENFNCLQSSKHHGWLEQLSMTWPVISIVGSFKSLGKARDTFAALMPRKIFQQYVDHLALVGKVAIRRLNAIHTTPTLMSIIQPSSREPDSSSAKQAQLSDREILSNAELVVTAGTDTTATALSAITYFLTANPASLQKVIAEVRAFSSEEDAAANANSATPYLSACIQEALRLYDPVPEGLPRLSPPGGEEICGYWIPEGTCCQVSRHAANHSSANFTDADQFIPERWLHSDPEASARFALDKKLAYRLFSTGPRDCIGQSFALKNIKTIMSRLLYRYDLELASKDNWLDQRSYLLWRRRALMVNLIPVAR